MELSAWHTRIATRLREIELDRESPAHLIEHGCSPAEVEEITAAARQALSLRALHDPYWHGRYLTLLLVATEVGYAFGEDGHVYWPKLSERLGVDFDASSRAVLAGYFPPPPTPPVAWAAHYSLISRPVTHAVLPRWLHEPLLELLLACPPGVPYFDWLLAQSSRNRKLQILLHSSREPIARAVIEGILEASPAQLVGEETLARFRTDIRESHTTRRLLVRAQIRRPTVLPAPQAPQRAPGRGPTSSRPNSLVGLVLSLDPLCIHTSPLGDIGTELLLQADSLRVFAFSERRPTSLSAALRDGIRMTRPLPPSDGLASLFSEPGIASVTGPTRTRLLSLQADVTPPLLFTEARGPHGVAVQVLRKTFSPTSALWLLAADPPPVLAGLTPRGTLHGLHCVRVDATCPPAADWLGSLGFSESKTPSLRLLGSAALDGPAGSTFDRDDVVALSVEHGPVASNGALFEDGLYALGTDERRTFENPAGGGSTELLVKRLSAQPRPPIVEIDLYGETVSADALRQGRLGLRIQGQESVSGVRARVGVAVDGIEVAAVTTARLPTLPCALGPAEPFWRELCRELPPDGAIVLYVDVAGLGRARWWLDTEIEEVSWKAGVPVTERDITGFRFFDEHAPLAETIVPSGVFLKVPSYRVGEPGPGAALCMAPKTMPLGRSSPRPPARFPREWPQVAPLLMSYQTWSTATAAHLLAESGRIFVAGHLDTWVERALCGEAWADASQNLPKPRAFGDIIAASLRDEGVLRDEIAEDGWPSTHEQALLREVGRSFEGGEEWLVGIRDGWLDADVLVPLLHDAYRAVGCRPEAGNEPDLACEQEAVSAALTRGFDEWDAQRELRPLLGRILPQSRRAALRDLAYTELTEEGLIDGLHHWLKTGSMVAAWPREQVASLLGLWLWPSRVKLQESLFTRALADQQGARAIRYASLRRRTALG